MGYLVSGDLRIVSESLFISLALEINEHREINSKVHTLTFFQATDDQGLLNCTSCHEIVGVKDKKERHSLRLFKWGVALQRSRELDWETCSVQEIVSAQLLALIDEQAAYKFLVYNGDAEDSKTAMMVSGSLTSVPTIFALGLHPNSFGPSPLISCTQPLQSQPNAQ